MDEAVRHIGTSDLYGKSQLNPIGVTLLLIFGFAMLSLPRRQAMISMIACASFIATGQRLVIFSLDFNFMRIMVLFGWARLILRQEFTAYRWNRVDGCIIIMAIFQVITFTITNGPSGFVWRLGTSLESIGGYFLARFLIRDLNDVRSLIYGLSIISIPVAFAFLIERSTQRNPFAAFGGVDAITQVREGKVRCMGAYSHPITAGCFWAAIFPLICAQLFSKGFLPRVMAIIGLFSSLVTIACSNSSTPITGLIAATIGFGMIPARKHMRLVRWACVGLLCVLQMSMKSNVWMLVGRTDLVGGSTGWHRAHLIDMFITRFNEWLLYGVKDISHWGVGNNDVCNHYALIGVQGGAPTLIVFILMIAWAFGNVGRTWRRVEFSRGDFLLTWAIGVSLFVHTVNFIGVSYFGQIDFLWYIALALTTVVPVGRIPGRSIGSTIASRVDSSPARGAKDVLRPGYR